VNLPNISDNKETIKSSIDLLNNLRIVKLNAEQPSLLMNKVNTSNDGDFAIHKVIRKFPTVQLDNDFNSSVLEYYESTGVKIRHINASDVDAY
jgi:hypothetical protein